MNFVVAENYWRQIWRVTVDLW